MSLKENKTTNIFFLITIFVNERTGAAKLQTCSSDLKKVRFYIAQCQVRMTVHSARHFTYLLDLFNQTLSRLLWEASSHMLQLIRLDWSYTYQSQSIAR